MHVFPRSSIYSGSESSNETEVDASTPKPRKRSQQYKDYNRNYAREYRRRMSDEKKELIREQSKLRMRRYRAKQKNLPKRVPTPHELKKRRARWREAKRRQRERLTPEVKEKQELNALQRRVNKLTPSLFAEVLLQTTPRKKDYLKSLGIYNSPNTKKANRISRRLVTSFKNHASVLKTKRDNKSRRKLKNLVKCASGMNVFGLKWKTFKQYSIIDEDVERSERSDALSEQVRVVIHNFFKDHSRPLPNARQAGKAVLTDTTKRLHREWLDDKSKPRISLSKFKKMRPQNVLTVDRTKFMGCLCEYCLNMDYLVSC